MTAIRTAITPALSPPAGYATWLAHYYGAIKPTHEVYGDSNIAKRRLAAIKRVLSEHPQDADHIHDLLQPGSLARWGFKEVCLDPSDDEMMSWTHINGGPLCCRKQGLRACVECVNKSYRTYYSHDKIVCYKAHQQGLPTILAHFEVISPEHGTVASCRRCEAEPKEQCPLSSIHKWDFSIRYNGRFVLREAPTPNTTDKDRLYAMRQEEKLVLLNLEGLNDDAIDLETRLKAAVTELGTRTEALGDEQFAVREELSQIKADVGKIKQDVGKIKQDQGKIKEKVDLMWDHVKAHGKLYCAMRDDVELSNSEDDVE